MAGQSESSGSSSEDPAAGGDHPKKLSKSSSLVNDNNSDFVDWQSTKCELKERFKYILQNELFCDVQFIVGSGTNIKRIGAHKLVLSAGSIIFLTMFSEKWSTDIVEIEVPDVEPAAFSEMLRFLYSDNIALTSENVIAVFYAAKKYSILALENKCVNFILSQLSPESAFNILIQGRLFINPRLVDACLEIIAENTIETLKTDDFCDIDVETLCLVLERSDLRIQEAELFDAVLRWSEAACKKKDLPICPENQLLVLKNALSLVRFPLMHPDVFASKVADSGLLSEKETISVMRYFIDKVPENCLFSGILRRPFHVASRFRSFVCGESYGHPSSVHYLLFSSDTTIRLLGIGLYGSPDCSAEYPVDVSLRQYNYSAVLTQFSGVYDGSKKIFRLMFGQPYALVAKTTYQLQVKIMGEYFHYGCNGLQTITVNINTDTKVTFSFDNYESVSSEQDRGRKTDSRSGQIPEILFEV